MYRLRSVMAVQSVKMQMIVSKNFIAPTVHFVITFEAKIIDRGSARKSQSESKFLFHLDGIARAPGQQGNFLETACASLCNEQFTVWKMNLHCLLFKGMIVY